MKKLKDLPRSDDEFWDESEKHASKPRSIELCDTHEKNNWTKHIGYKDNHDGTISCKFCGWGCFLPGYMKVHEGKVFDLRLAQ